MGLYNDVSRPEWVVAASLTGGAQSPAEPLLGLINASITVTYTTTVAAGSTFSLQTSDFGTAGGPPASNQWTTLPGSTQSVPTTASPIGWQLQNIGSKWVRVVFNDGGSSSGTYSAAFTGRGTT